MQGLPYRRGRGYRAPAEVTANEDINYIPRSSGLWAMVGMKIITHQYDLQLAHLNITAGWREYTFSMEEVKPERSNSSTSTISDQQQQQCCGFLLLCGGDGVGRRHARQNRDDELEASCGIKAARQTAASSPSRRRQQYLWEFRDE
uniref:Uncharacterized protein n=1 Tax=Oryza rufipogon TaxID=4529 RepID=A0A0E0REF0_ORYRU